MLEKAVFFAEYENINKDGQPVRGAIILAELVSCVKRGLARMLVIIVCLGFGIIKPRLGQTLHKVLLAGELWVCRLGSDVMSWWWGSFMFSLFVCLFRLR